MKCISPVSISAVSKVILLTALAAFIRLLEGKKLYHDQAQIDFLENLPNDIDSRDELMSIYNEMATFHNMVGNTNQHILVVPLTLNPDNTLSYNVAESLAYVNVDWAAFENSADYDPESEEEITNRRSYRHPHGVAVYVWEKWKGSHSQSGAEQSDGLHVQLVHSLCIEQGWLR